MIDPALDAITKESQRSIELHLEDYKAKLRAGDRDKKHVGSTISYIMKICKAAGFATAGDIAADGVNRFANDLREADKSARTIQAYLIAVKGFAKWLASHHKVHRDPLASVSAPDPKADRRRERRMLLPEEWGWLESVTMTNSERYGMSGRERTILYETAIQTGLRSGELRSLTRRSLHLEADSPYVTCRAGTTKNRKPARQYILPALAADLRQHIATKAPQAAVFAMPQDEHVAEMLRNDLADARREWLKQGGPEEQVTRDQSDFLTVMNHDGEALDFHSLRHTCGAWLARADVHPKMVQTVMRHSAITLTMDTYGHLFPGAEIDAVSMMEKMLTTHELMQATGTDDIEAKGAQRLAQRANLCKAVRRG